MKKYFFGVYNPAIILTYLSTFSAIFGMALLTTQSYRYMTICIVLLMISAIADMFDGRVARMCKRTEIEKSFGIQQDSLSDTVAFVVYPALLLIKLSGFSWHSLVIALFYVFAGIMRLGWFNVTTEENPGMFQGMPVPFCALILPIAYIIYRYAEWSTVALFELPMLILGGLFIGNFKMKKPGIKVLIGFVILAIIVLVLLVVQELNTPLIRLG